MRRPGVGSRRGPRRGRQVERTATPAEAVAGAELVLSLATAAHALDAATSVVSALGPAQLYADLNTTAPALKREVAAAIAPTGAGFADVALLGGVPARGVGTPALASGDGAEHFAELMRPLGMPVEVVGREPGEAAGLKLAPQRVHERARRSRCSRASRRRADAAPRTGSAARSPTSSAHSSSSASSRGASRTPSGAMDEMDDAAAYLGELGVEPRVTEAAAGWLRQLADEKRARPA